jgi:hypothetical protein
MSQSGNNQAIKRLCTFHILVIIGSIRVEGGQMAKIQRKHSGQAFIELAIGTMILIPLLLFLLDIFFCILCNQANDVLTKSAARAAAGSNSPLAAAEKIVADSIFGKGTGPVKASLVWFDFNNGEIKQGTPEATGMAGAHKVVVVVKMSVTLPAPIPFLNSTPVFKAQSVEPTVNRNFDS